jgi:hypothetical protein
MKGYVSDDGALSTGDGLKIVAVVGSGSGCGKTTIVCRILRSIPGLGAVKISPREGPSRVEWGRGKLGKDTDLYADSGATYVARIVGPRDQVVEAWNQIKNVFESCPAVVVEGSGSVNLPGERLTIYVDGGISDETRKERGKDLSVISDIIVRRSPHMSHEFWLYNKSPSHFGVIDSIEKVLHNKIIAHTDKDILSEIRRFLSI